MSLFAELKRRNVIRMAGLYLVGAWLLTQVSSTVLPMFDAPAWLPRSLVFLLAIGFVPALIFAWIFELTPEGIRRDADVKPEDSIAPQTARRMDRMLIAILICALVYFGVDKFVLAPRREAALVTQTEQSLAARAAPGQHAQDDKSIAVLPFLDLSPNHDQGYFSDGMSEEILNALAQVKDLKVAGRTSSFYFKDRNENLRTIGKTLGVANLLEGSVRKQGDKVRITAQLIRVADDTHLWSHDYDGNLSDVFQLQDDIARAITDQLKVVLVGDQSRRLVPVATNNTDAYNLYLQATDALNHRDYKRMGDAIGWLEQAIKFDPDFAAARARLAMIHVIGWSQYGASKSEAAHQAQIATEQDPKLAETQYALGFLARQERHFVDARKAIDRALELAPNDASSDFYDAQLLINTGYTRRGIAQLDRALAIDPILPNALHWRALQYLFAGDLDTAEGLWKRAGDAGLSYADVGLARAAQARGDFAKARALSIPNLLANPNGTACLQTPTTSVPLYFEGVDGGDAQAQKRALAVVDQCLAARPNEIPLWAAQGLHDLDRPERTLQVIAQGPTSDDAGLFNFFWSPQWSDVRRLPEFATFARKVGFADLWDKYGAPDLCHKNAAGDYVCE